MSGFQYRWRLPRERASVNDWRTAARRAVPAMVWAYIEDGADACRTACQNEVAYADYSLRQRSLAGITSVDLQTTVAGELLDLPILLAPTGIAGLAHWSGDLACARAAQAAGTRYVLSTASSYSVEEVAGVLTTPGWFQLYPFGDRDKVAGFLDRAARSGYTTLFLTIDVPVRGYREAERRSGLTVPPTLTPGGVLDFIRHPRWTYGALRHRRMGPIHYAAGYRRSPGTAATAMQAQSRSMQSALDWDDLAWMRRHWKGRLYVKGVLDADDAQRAVEHGGVDGLVVSNHGGRQLDGVPATLRALPRIVERVGDKTEVLLDGGVRRASDVITALCLGARGVLIGRPYVYALAAAGEQGVADLLAQFKAGLERALTLMGCRSVRELGPGWLETEQRRQG